MVHGSTSATPPTYDRKSELMAFDETKTGVKGLVVAGFTEVPRIFLLPSPQNMNSHQQPHSKPSLPIIDLEGINGNPILQKAVIDKLKGALETWGFFQMVNHGIPTIILEEMMKGVIRFHEQDTEVKKQWYKRDAGNGRVLYNSNFDLYSSPVTNWRDTFHCIMAPNLPQRRELPPPCRNILMDYSSRMLKLGGCLFKLISEALGLEANHLVDMGCGEGLSVLGHYYPSCPQPELTIGINDHTDGDFMTILLQDHTGGLQVLHENQWIAVPPIPGAFVVIAGDLLQA